MAEKRRQPRKKRRFLIQVETSDSVSTGFTYDLSVDGIFIRSVRIPQPGSTGSEVARSRQWREVGLGAQILKD